MKSYTDFVLFGKVISSALLVVGYILLGFYIGDHLVKRGYPPWTQPTLTVLGAGIGVHQMFLVVREMIRKLNK